MIVVTIYRDNKLTDRTYRVEVSEPPDPAGEKVLMFFGDMVDTTSHNMVRTLVAVQRRVGEDRLSQVALIAADVVAWVP